MRKKLLIIVGVLLLLVLAMITYFVVFPWAMMALGITLLPNPPKPEITYGEFPFRLEYEINGKRIIVEDTFVCEYDGIGINEGEGKFRKWKGYLSSNGGDSVLLVTDDTRMIYLFVGSAEYYMGDEKYPEKRPLTPRIYMVKLSDMDTSIFSQDELLDYYNIKLISWSFTEPIVNNFLSN